MTIGSIGAGHMGSAILRSVLDSGLYTPDRIHISSPVASELEPFAARGCSTGLDNLRTARNAELIVLAVRPGQAIGVLEEIAPVCEDTCILSICAGVTVGSMKASLPRSASVLRVMPNLPVVCGLGATVMATPEDVPERFVESAKAIFRCGGIVELMDETLINAVTSLGGSAVAYFFRMADVMAGWAKENGIPPDAALRIAAQTMSGAAKMLTGSGKTPDELANGVAVPGGMTEAAFKAFDSAGFDAALKAGMDACRNRGIELVSLS
ncbi:MAG: pyrroline-5-carboxylate reductase [Oscillospiraceae bacterium]|nr:pyrroline-5-carboxylate reductase [Oscillospiraceae bacterium]